MLFWFYILDISISHHENKKTRIRSKKDDQEKKEEEIKHALDQESKTAITTKKEEGRKWKDIFNLVEVK